MIVLYRMVGPILLLIPPLTQLNTPYPSTAMLTGFLRARGYDVRQADLGIEMVLAVFSREGLEAVFDRARGIPDLPGEARQMLALAPAYVETIEPVVRFLQGADPSLAPRICQRRFLPEGPRFATVPASRSEASADVARLLATKYLEDLADFIHATVTPQFALSRYAEQIGQSATAFEPIRQALAAPATLTDELLLAALRRHIERVQPALVGLTVPFPGNLYGALRIAQAIRRWRPNVKLVLGGGYVNTELRRLADPAVFEFVDYVTLDDGERPLLCLLEHVAGKREARQLCRTFLCEGQGSRREVVWHHGALEPDFGMTELGTPTYDGLPLERYLSVLDTLNPMHRLWSDGHWNKLMVAHGCYWKQCTFCDVGLDYIGRYEAAPHEVLADRIEALLAETGRRGFHFVDEAAPPAALKALALTLLERRVAISWWGNIRFEAAFTPDLCRLLAAAGCIAVTAGLEAASDRQLTRMKKGITVDQTAGVAAAFRASGILVHAYLMYGLPGQSLAETLDALERVRQLFAAGLLQSAFWHRFVATAHSPVGLDPQAHGIRILGPRFAGFAENDLVHEDVAEQVPDWLGDGLRRALYNYLEGRGLAADVREWFPGRVPKPRVKPDWARRVGAPRAEDEARAERRLVWIGGEPAVEPAGRGAVRLVLPNRREDAGCRLARGDAERLLAVIRESTPALGKAGERYPLLRDLRAQHPGGHEAFDAWLRSPGWRAARRIGLLLV